MHSLLWFMLCCFVLEILNKTNFICEVLAWPTINQMLQAPSFTLYLNFANSFKAAAPILEPFTPSGAFLRVQTHCSSSHRTTTKKASLSHEPPDHHCHITFKLRPCVPSNLPLYFKKKCSLGFPSPPRTP